MIQPIDIRSTKFKKGFFGFKTDEVKSFVDFVYKSYSEVYNENKKLKEDLDKINESLQEARVKIFDLENKVQKNENVLSYGEEAEAKKKAEQIIKNAEEAATEIISKAKLQSDKIEDAVMINDNIGDEEDTVKVETHDDFIQTIKVEPLQDDDEEFFKEAKATASSKFFEVDNTNEDSDDEEDDIVKPAVEEDDDDEIFVGEIEEPVKRDRMMIGDGEEEDVDFEFL